MDYIEERTPSAGLLRKEQKSDKTNLNRDRTHELEKKKGGNLAARFETTGQQNIPTFLLSKGNVYNFPSSLERAVAAPTACMACIFLGWFIPELRLEGDGGRVTFQTTNRPSKRVCYICFVILNVQYTNLSVNILNTLKTFWKFLRNTMISEKHSGFEK